MSERPVFHFLKNKIVDDNFLQLYNLQNLKSAIIIIICFYSSVICKTPDVQDNAYLKTNAAINLNLQEEKFLKEHPVIRLGFNPYMEPLLIKNSDSFGGVYPQIFKELENVLGITISIEVGDWSTIVQKVRERKLDGLLACAPPQAKASNLLRTKSIHISYPVVFNKQNASFRIKNVDDIKGKRIAYQKEVKMLEVVLDDYRETCEILPVKSTLEAISMVLDGTVDVAFGVNFENYLVLKHSLAGIKIDFFDLEHSNPIASGIRNDWPELVSILNKGLDQIGDARINDILTEWTAIPQKPGSLLTKEEMLWLKEHPVIKVGSAARWAPIEFMDSNNEFYGISIDYLRMVEEMLPLKFDIVKERSLAVLAQKAKKGEIDLFTNVSLTTERQKFLSFTEPYTSFPVLIYTRSEVNYIPEISHLKGKRIAVLKGFAIEEWLKEDYPDLDLITFEAIDDALIHLAHGKVFAYLGNLVTTGYYIRENGLTNIKAAGKTEYVYDSRMAVKKDWPILAGIIQKALDAITDDQKKSIYSKWISVHYKNEFNYTLLWSTLGAGLFIVLIFVWSNIRLRNAVQKRTAQLLRSEELFRNVADFTYDWEYWQLPDGSLKYISPSCERISGYTRDEFFKNPKLLNSIVLDSDQKIWLTHKNHEEEKSEYLEFRITNKDGSVKWIGHECNRLLNENGESLGIRVSNRDISDLKNMYEQLQQSQKMRAVGQLAGGIAHDFNNMLTAIIGFADMSLENISPNNEIYRYLNNILKASSRAKKLVNQILTFSRRGGEKKSSVNLKPIINEVIDMLMVSLPSSINLCVNIHNDTQAVMADSTKIHESVMNLATNAVHAMDEQGDLTISLYEEKIDETILGSMGEIKPNVYSVIEVKDNGSGISKDDLDLIFEPFFTTKKIGEGTGLGLSVVFGVMQSHDGNIIVNSVLGEGTSFKLYLPITELDTIDNENNITKVLNGEERILFVDDEPLLEEMALKMLSSLGYKVTSTTDSIEALSIFNENPNDFDLLITDQTMPSLTGLELSKKILEIRQDIPIILCTGYSTKVDKKVADKYGITEFAKKPMSKRDYSDVIRKIFDNNDMIAQRS